MHVATVIPIARGIPFDSLSYYSNETLPVGTLVTIPFGKQVLAGIVLETTPLVEAKTAIKGAQFSLKKIKQVLGTFPYFAHLAQALATSAAMTLAPAGAIAGSVVPATLFEYINREKVAELLPQTSAEQVFTEELSVGTTTERIDEYKRIIRSAFAAKKSVLFIAPTIRALTEWSKHLEKGIQKHILLMHSKVAKKELRSNFSAIKSSERPLAIFATPGYSVIPRADIGVMIIESESSSLYRTSDRYGIDLRMFLRAFAEQRGSTLFWGDSMPRFESLARLDKTHLPRTYIPEKLHIVPLEKYRTVLPTEVIELVRHAQVKGKRLFLYTNRKGIAPLSRCSDCGTLVTCPTCTLPMVLRNIVRDGKKERSFICTHCGDTLPATHVCSYCGSWNISPLSIGTESIAEEVAKLVGPESVYAVDDDITPDSVTVENLIREFQKKKFAVVVGTIKILPHLKGVHYTLIPFFDRILSTPSLYTTEQALRMIMECNERALDGVLLCTRNPDFPLIRQLEMHKINAIVHDELALRQELGYPPYGALIKIALTVPEGYRQKIKSAVDEYLTGYDVTALAPRRVSLGSMKVLMVWILKAGTDYIENEGTALMQFLETLHFPYRIEQNPERFQ